MIAAIGECGLDYTIINSDGDKNYQKILLLRHFELANRFGLPMFFFFKGKGSCTDLLGMMNKMRKLVGKGVVSNFTGTIYEMQKLLAEKLYISVSASSLKTKELCEMVKHIPLSNLLVESNCPESYTTQHDICWGMVKSRFDLKREDKYNPKDDNHTYAVVRERGEPCLITQVYEIIAELK